MNDVGSAIGPWDDGWVEPDVADLTLYVDQGDDPARFDHAVRRWCDGFARLLPDAVGIASDARWSILASSELPDGKEVDRRPRSFSGMDTTHLRHLVAGVRGAAENSAEVNLEVRRFDDPKQVLLAVTVTARGLDVVLPRLLQLAQQVGDDIDPTYGELVVNTDFLRPDTGLDLALGRHLDDSAEAARRYLRGYEWTTIIPAQLVQRLGGTERLKSAELYAVTPLRGGGAIVQATAAPHDFTGERVNALFEVLRPVLPPGQPRQLKGLPLPHVVLADAGPE